MAFFEKGSRRVGLHRFCSVRCFGNGGGPGVSCSVAGILGVRGFGREKQKHTKSLARRKGAAKARRMRPAPVFETLPALRGACVWGRGVVVHFWKKLAIAAFM